MAKADGGCLSIEESERRRLRKEYKEGGEIGDLGVEWISGGLRGVSGDFRSISGSLRVFNGSFEGSQVSGFSGVSRVFQGGFRESQKVSLAFQGILINLFIQRFI